MTTRRQHLGLLVIVALAATVVASCEADRLCERTVDCDGLELCSAEGICVPRPMGPTACATNADCVFGLVCHPVDMVCVTLEAAKPPTAGPDTVDTITALDTEEEEVIPIPTCDDVPAGFACACESDTDCASGVCLPTTKNPVCTEPCDAGCPDGWTCATLPGAAAASCVPLDCESGCDDGLACTEDLCNGYTEGCTHVAMDGSCYIDGACYEPDDPKPTDPCMVCTPSINVKTFLTKKCPDGQVCNASTGVCEDEVVEPVTWTNTIETIFKKRCVSCHWDMGTYQGVKPYCDANEMYYWIDIGHFIYGDERTVTLEWLDAGYPE